MPCITRQNPLYLKVCGQNYEARVYFLFEHKSTNFSNTPLQLLRYMLEI